MATLAEVQATIATLHETVVSVSAKMDDISALVASLRAGAGVGDADLEGLRTSLEAVASVLGGVVAKQNAILG